jgi:hypothetical protein
MMKFDLTPKVFWLCLIPDESPAMTLVKVSSRGQCRKIRGHRIRADDIRRALADVAEEDVNQQPDAASFSSSCSLGPVL